MDATWKLYRAILLKQDGKCAYGIFHHATQEKGKLIYSRKRHQIFYFIYFILWQQFCFLRSTEMLLLGNNFYNASINGIENLGMSFYASGQVWKYLLWTILDWHLNQMLSQFRLLRLQTSVVWFFGFFLGRIFLVNL